MKSQRRTERIVIRVEPLITNALARFILASEGSQSEYVRKLIIKDLHERGLLPDGLLMEMLC